ncbi:MAG TPA: ABC transporter permease [Gemmatimonadales bacterium]|nr:ABC transporter permease [Gemmatimonadales bacterium]
MGPTLLTVYPGQSFMRGIASGTRVSVTLDDDTALENNGRHVRAVVPELTRAVQVQKGDQNINVNVVGTAPGYAPVHSYTFTTGRMFRTSENAARRRLAVLGASVPGMLNVNPAGIVGQGIVIRGIVFEAIGVCAEKGSQGSFFNPDEQILIPLQTVEALVLALAGGLLGLTSGVIGALAISKLAHWNTLISPGAVLLAITIDALRYE